MLAAVAKGKESEEARKRNPTEAMVGTGDTGDVGGSATITNGSRDSIHDGQK